jgi:hypothetical protein
MHVGFVVAFSGNDPDGTGREGTGRTTLRDQLVGTARGTTWLARFRSWCYFVCRWWWPSGSAAVPHTDGGVVASSGGVLVWCSVAGSGCDLVLCSVVRVTCIAIDAGADVSRRPLSIHVSCSLSDVPNPRLSSPPYRSSVGSGEKMVPWCALSLSAFVVVLISCISGLLLLRLQLLQLFLSGRQGACHCMGMVEDWFIVVSWQGVRGERRVAQAKVLPSWSGASNDDTHGCHSSSWRRRCGASV